MIAVCRYLLRELFSSARHLAGVVLYLAIMVVWYANPMGSLLPAFSLPALMMSVLAAWLTWVIASLPGPNQWAMSAAAVGGQRKMVAGVALGAATLCVPVAVVSCLAGMWAYRDFTPRDVVLGLIAHLACAAQGIALTLFTGRGIWRTTTSAVLLTLIAQVAVFAVPVSASRLVVTTFVGGYLPSQTDVVRLVGAFGVFVLLGVVATALQARVRSGHP